MKSHSRKFCRWNLGRKTVASVDSRISWVNPESSPRLAQRIEMERSVMIDGERFTAGDSDIGALLFGVTDLPNSSDG